MLVANEVTAARKYTQVYAGNDLYTQIAGANNPMSRDRVATILFASRVTTQTWFAADILYSHGIQWLPFTAAGSSQLLPVAWMSEALPIVASRTTTSQNR
jgi:hypothetical protein